MLLSLLMLFLFADPYWVSKPPSEWTDAQLRALLTNSPWAQPVEGPGANAPPVEVFLATAAPIQLAEKENDRRVQARRRPGPALPESPAITEYANKLYGAWRGSGQDEEASHGTSCG